MNICYINDLHIDTYVKRNKNLTKYLNSIRKFVKDLIDSSKISDKDVLIIAGDLSHYNNVSFRALFEFSLCFNLVIFVPGNHDYYLITKSQQNRYKSSVNRIEHLISRCQALSNVKIFHHSQNNNTLTYKGKTFGGSTMTSKPVTQQEINFYHNHLNDSLYVTEEPAYLNRQDMVAYHELINKNLDVFISHYPLITTKSHFTLSTKGSNTSYKCEVDEIIAPICFFGHVHENACYQFKNSLHYTNAYGYPHEGLNATINQLHL